MKKLLALLTLIPMMLSSLMINTYSLTANAYYEVPAIDDDGYMRNYDACCETLNKFIKENELRAKLLNPYDTYQEVGTSTLICIKYYSIDENIPEIIQEFMTENKIEPNVEVQFLAVDEDPSIVIPPITDLDEIRTKLTEFINEKQLDYIRILPADEIPEGYEEGFVYYEWEIGKPNLAFYEDSLSNIDLSLVVGIPVDFESDPDAITDPEQIKSLLEEKFKENNLPVVISSKTGLFNHEYIYLSYLYLYEEAVNNIVDELVEEYNIESRLIRSNIAESGSLDLDLILTPDDEPDQVTTPDDTVKIDDISSDNVAALEDATVITIKKGDLNSDNVVTSVDATIILIKYTEALANDTVIKADELPGGDYNDDGYVDAKDSTAVLVTYAEDLINL